MIEDLPIPEPTPANTKQKIESIQMVFDDAGNAYVTVIMIKGSIDSNGNMRKDESTRERFVADSVPIGPNMGPKKIIQAVKLAIAEKATRASLFVPPSS